MEGCSKGIVWNVQGVVKIVEAASKMERSSARNAGNLRQVEKHSPARLPVSAGHLGLPKQEMEAEAFRLPVQEIPTEYQEAVLCRRRQPAGICG